MCGLCGVYDLGAAAPRETVTAMRRALAHRGPDDEGEFFSGGVGLGFRRLSILDLENGHQPMTRDGATVVFNGEIYNHPEIAADLVSKGAGYKTKSDTESILLLYLREGLEAFARLDGMFAVAVWDEPRRRLVLARDGLGVKPLYYSFDGRRLIFSSEVRSLLAGGVSKELDPAGTLDYLAYGKVHAPRTILRDVMKLQPGHRLVLYDRGLSVERFYALPRRRSVPRSVEEAVDALDETLSRSVKASMLSDVPVGCFLSGGLDSSLVAAYMTRHASGRVKTFSVGFEGAGRGVDESAFARRAAEHLGTDHHPLMLKADVLSRLERSIALLDEPIADSAILPTFLLAEHARNHVKVALTGEGADELFAGYNRYKAAWLNEKLRRLPAWSRRLAAPIARRMGKGLVFDRLPYDSADQWARATASAQPEELKAVLSPGFWEATRHADPLDWLKDFGAMSELDDALDFDLRTVLADSLLMKVDKTTMRASLEARVPFLNKSVVEHALSLPSSFKIRRFKGKYLLRLVAQRYLPRELVWRKKHGFIVPWEPWVRDPRNQTIARLLESRSIRSGPFDAGRLRRFHEDLCAGSRAVEAGLFFRVAVLALWLESLSAEAVAA